MLARSGVATAVALLLLALCGSAQAATKPVARAKLADKATNASKVNGLKAARTPKAGQLVALDKNGKFPASVLPAGVFPPAAGAPGAQGAQGPAGATGPAGAQGPVGATGTVDTSNFFTKAQSDARFLQLGADGSLLATGTLGVGQIPATGCGYRLMWHPYKAAFRAGSPGGCPGAAPAWDDASVGYYSWAGGSATTASAYGSLAFGDTATASGTDAVAFGSATTASGTASLACCASGKAEGFASTALGFTTRATGQGAVALGYRVGAFGDYSTALGNRAVTASGCPGSGTCDLSAISPSNGFDGAFVWGDDSTTASVAATADNQWTARAAGGFRLFTNSALTTGCSLPAGSGVFSCTSDRNAKHDFRAVDRLDVLERLSKVPVTTWRYKTEAGAVRHMGPTAQDFHAAFGLGPDDKHIGSIDEDGVNTAAIQALYALSQRQQRQLAAQQTRIARLERRLARRR